MNFFSSAETFLWIIYGTTEKGKLFFKKAHLSLVVIYASMIYHGNMVKVVSRYFNSLKSQPFVLAQLNRKLLDSVGNI